MTEPVRRRQLQRALQAVQEQIARQTELAGRPANDVRLVVVTKTWPASDVTLLNELGVRDFGENRIQEAEQKAAALAHLDLRWHFVGQVQSKKAGKVATWAHLVHSVDSVRLAQRLDAGAQRSERILDCLVQVNLDASADHSAETDQPAERAATAHPPHGVNASRRGGVPPRQVSEIVEAVEKAVGLRLAGVMGVAPTGVDPRPSYLELAELATRLRALHPHATVISAGMSGDFASAIDAGATHVRVGSAILGQRPPLG